MPLSYASVSEQKPGYDPSVPLYKRGVLPSKLHLHLWRTENDSNIRLRFRRPVLIPLSYRRIFFF